MNSISDGTENRPTTGSTALERLSFQLLPSVEDEMRRHLKDTVGPALPGLRQMLEYALGLDSAGSPSTTRGKRVRPLLLLLSVIATGGNWRRAIPAAVATEMIHNFSLIHDDIEDHDETRRGAPSLWAKWGIPQAINTGDSVFILAFSELETLKKIHSPGGYQAAQSILNAAVVSLTNGQYEDLAGSERPAITMAEYRHLIEGKTAALMKASTELGATLGGGSAREIVALCDFGRALGLAFQIHDDLLGIWGKQEQTGKSTSSDLLNRKKSFPIVFALERAGPFYRRWSSGLPFSPEEIPSLAQMLVDEGALEATQYEERQLTGQALSSLDSLNGPADPIAALRELALQLVERSG